ncbi:YqcC family protein [Halieaceae bacterium IMCC14734]|uniref:YqcC family protein n=1 Tax=Candidatus Litorirhabdus singularis TaxID=2518993 RepID=A0ABT3TAU2_9GAMM|nr:YqcC family protein [Candidatus Litorirhabdus singularis]MCX2979375.1 YqcC family protein [Candidatus Litorirhabdus singularis]
MQLHDAVASLLMDVEAQLRMLELWQAEAPKAAALASTEPFAMDSLRLEQWLQFIFLPRLRQLIESGQALPSASGVAPMAVEVFRDTGIASAKLEHLLADIDRLLSDKGVGLEAP